MNEAAARETLFVRAHERQPSALWSEADRTWATQAAAQVVGEGASDEAFIARRAAFAVERLRPRDKSVARLLGAVTWRPWIGVALAVAAFAAGLALDAVGPGRHVNLLAPPLLALLAWNLIVYAWIAVRGALGLVSARARGLGPLARGLARAAHAVGHPAGQLGGGAGSEFLATWAVHARTLTAARVGRVLHAAAVALALGALASMYLRGLAFEFRAGWQSTFLDEHQVHALLSLVLGPASALTGIGLPSVEGFAALRMPPSVGVNAAPWLHLHAVTVALVVLLPRALLALGDALVEARLARRFPLRLDDAYYKRLARTLRGTAARVTVLPYSTQLSAQATLGLNHLLAQALGAGTGVTVAPSVGYGGDEGTHTAAPARDATVLMPLFASVATPERETHGVFAQRQRQALPAAAQFVALIDETAFARQFPGDQKRLVERRDAWRAVLKEAGCPVVFAALEQPDAAAFEHQLTRALDVITADERA
jgi:hypothetical protein